MFTEPISAAMHHCIPAIMDYLAQMLWHLHLEQLRPCMQGLGLHLHYDAHL